MALLTNVKKLSTKRNGSLSRDFSFMIVRVSGPRKDPSTTPQIPKRTLSIFSREQRRGRSMDIGRAVSFFPLDRMDEQERPSLTLASLMLNPGIPEFVYQRKYIYM